MSQRVMRLLDILIALLALVILSPLLLLVCLAIWFCMGRPVLFRQERLGEHGRVFTMLKFRTMQQARLGAVVTVDSVNDYSIKLKGDPRITPLGAVLRKTSIDELPQLINVLCGEMSIVGPRPWVGDEYDRMPADWRQRLHGKPGITGLAQINGRSDLPPEDIISYDIQWNRSPSLRLYLKIIVLTPFRIVQGHSSY